MTRILFCNHTLKTSYMHHIEIFFSQRIFYLIIHHDEKKLHTEIKALSVDNFLKILSSRLYYIQH